MRIMSSILTRSNISNYHYKNDDILLDILYCAYHYNDNNKHQSMHHGMPANPVPPNTPANFLKEFQEHSFYEMQLILKGTTRYCFSDHTEVSVKEGQLILLPPRTKHMLKGTNAQIVEKIVMEFGLIPQRNPKTPFYQAALSLMQKPLVIDYNEHIHTMINHTIQNLSSKPHEYELSNFFMLSCCIIETLQLVVGNNAIKPESRYKDARIGKALEYIHENITATLTVAEVAEMVYLSKKQFTRIFTQTVGFPPGTYIRDYRITCICEYLKDPNLNVEDIAALMKYSSASSLIMAFKKAKGITPKQFKERAENTI